MDKTRVMERKGKLSDLDRSFDLSFTSDHRIEFTFLRQLGEIASEAIQGGRLRLAPLAG